MVQWPWKRLRPQPQAATAGETAPPAGRVAATAGGVAAIAGGVARTAGKEITYSTEKSSQESYLGKFLQDIQWKVVGVLFLFFVLINLLWNSWIVYPLKILVVFFHESSHGLAAILTGGRIDHIEVSQMQGGVCYTAGGNRFWILSAGYLGSLVWGGIILTLASRTKFDRYISLVLGSIIIMIDVAYVRPFFLSFGSVFGILAGLGLVLAGYKLPQEINEFLLRITGLTSCMYATLDIKEDVIDRPGVHSDAWMLSQETGVPTLMWGILWISVAFVASLFFVLLACKPRMYGNDSLESCPSALQLPPPMSLPQQLEGWV